MILQLRHAGSGCRRSAAVLSAVLIQFQLFAGIVAAQNTSPTDPPPSASKSAGGDTQAAIIERLPLALRDPKSYQTPLVLKPLTAVDLVAQADGIVMAVQVLPNQAVARQSEAVRLESTERQLLLERAQAAVRAAQAAKGDDAAALLDVAKLDVKIAEQRLEQTLVRVPFDGTVTNIYVVPGQYVRAGDPLLRLADLKKLAVDLPVDRNQVKTGGALDVNVEEQKVAGQVNAVLPLLPRFEPLRELFLSIATAQVVIDNANGKFSEGQTVYTDVIPRAPVAEVPTLAVGSAADGSRRVQVIREGFVRDVPVALLGQSGNDYVYVTGRFGATDELIVKASRELRDGTRVLPATSLVKDEPATGGSRPPAQPGNRSPTGF